MLHLIVLEIGGMVQGSQCNYFWTFEPHIYTQWEISFSKLHLSRLSDVVKSGSAHQFPAEITYVVPWNGTYRARQRYARRKHVSWAVYTSIYIVCSGVKSVSEPIWSWFGLAIHDFAINVRIWEIKSKKSWFLQNHRTYRPKHWYVSAEEAIQSFPSVYAS